MKPTDRLYLQYKPDDEAMELLLEWQRHVLEVNPAARPVTNDHFHLTLIHVGILQEVFAQMREANNALEWVTFNDAIAQFVSRCQAVMPDRTEVIAEEIARYGSRGEVLAVRVRPDSGLVEAYSQCLAYLIACLKACGITYPAAFMQGNRNLRFALEFNPHLTLVRAARQLLRVPVNRQRLKLSMLPIQYQ